MISDSFDDILKEARDHFHQNKYSPAENLLNQLILRNYKSAEIFHMLGVIYYDQGKFNKAIRSLQRALEIDPSFTDSSVGLSIILNDLGRYEEGRKIFNDARSILNTRSHDDDPHLNEKLSTKHDELGELYFRYKRFTEALEQYKQALGLSSRKAELTMKIVACHVQLDEKPYAIRALKELIREYPQFSQARIQLGRIFYDDGQVTDAIEVWEDLLSRDPKNLEARQLIQKAQAIDFTNLNSLDA